MRRDLRGEARRVTLVALAVLAALLDLAAVACGWHGVRVLTKPIPAILLAWAVWRFARAERTAAIGLLLAALGDEFLLASGTAAFAAGMAAFAGMHVCYIAAFLRLGTGRGVVQQRWWLVLPYAFAVVAVSAVLAPQAGALALPVAVYSALLGAMALTALDAAGRMTPRVGATLAAGGLLFMGSDTLLACATFVSGFPGGTGTQVAVMASYFAAQLAIGFALVASATTTAKANAS